MSDILEDTLQRLKDRSGAPVLEDPDALTDAVMMATEPRRPVSVWLTVLRICSSMAACLSGCSSVSGSNRQHRPLHRTVRQTDYTNTPSSNRGRA